MKYNSIEFLNKIIKEQKINNYGDLLLGIGLSNRQGNCYMIKRFCEEVKTVNVYNFSENIYGYTKKINDYDSTYINYIISKSNSVLDTIHNLKINEHHKMVMSYITDNNINISHFGINIYNRYNELPKYLFEEYVLVDNISISSYKLKEKLFIYKIKENKCEACKLSNWMNNKIVLEIHHIDGNKFNNKIENLMILCPNCHSQTHNFRNKNKHDYKTSKPINYGSIIFNNIYDYLNSIDIVIENKNKFYFIKKPILNKNTTKKKKEDNYCVCGTKIKKDSKTCIDCYSIIQRKVERPDYETLLLNVKEYGYVSTGRKYGVTDNAIRKWIKKYEKLNK